MAAKRFRRPTGQTGPRPSRRGLQNKPAGPRYEVRKALRAVAGNGHGKPLGLQPKQQRSWKAPLRYTDPDYRLRLTVAPRDPDDACYRAERARAERHLGRTPTAAGSTR